MYKHPVPKEVDMVKTVSRKHKDRIEEETRVAEPDLTLEGKVILVVGNDAEPEKCREYFTSVAHTGVRCADRVPTAHSRTSAAILVTPRQLVKQIRDIVGNTFGLQIQDDCGHHAVVG